MGGQLVFGVLGPVAVHQGDVEVAVPRRRQRLVLARLLLDAGLVVPTERLAEEIWGPDTGTSAVGSVRTNVWELRRLLDAGNGARRNHVLASRAGGYVLDVEPEQIDSRRFERHLGQARALTAEQRPAAALDAVERALALSRGPAFADLAGEAPFQVEAARLDQLVLEARELRAELLLAVGRHIEVAGALGAVAQTNPERERVWALLMVALYRSGRQVDALRCYQEARRRLTDIGVEPGPELRHLEQAILQHDPALDRTWPPAHAGRPAQPLVTAATAATTSANGSANGPAAKGSWGGPRARRHNLPRPLTELVGRERERAGVAEALARSRLVSLVGPGGCGKTRLAIAVAEEVLPQFPAGAWFVDLAGASGGSPVAGVVAAALGGEACLDAMDGSCAGSWWTDDEALLVLDNCEHLVGPVADYVVQLLDGAPRLRVLVTSRAELRLAGETVWRLAGLGLPTGGTGGAFLGSEAVELFVRRGAAALRDFAPSSTTLDQVATICRRLDGLPLAIELAASLVGTLPVAEIARQVDDHHLLVSEEPRPGARRRPTLGAAIGRSFGLLDPSTQELFVRLGVFAGSFTLATVETVLGGSEPGHDLPHRLGALVRASLLERVAGRDGVQRYRMLETVREYAVERLEQRADADGLRASYARAVAAFAVEADLGMRAPGWSTWREEVEAELPNVRAALRWSMVHDDVELALRILTSLRWCLSRLARPDELAGWLEDVLGRSPELPPSLRLGALTTSAMVAVLRGAFDHAGRAGREAAAMAPQVGDDHQQAFALIACAASALAKGDPDRGREHLQGAHALCSLLGDRWGLGWVRVGWANTSLAAGRAGEARRHMEEALDFFRAVGDLHGQVVPLSALALLALDGDETETAVDLASEAVHIVTVVEYEDARHWALAVLGLAELGAAHLLPGRERFLASLRHLPPDRESGSLPFVLEGLAMLAVVALNPVPSARLFGLAQHQRQQCRLVPTPRWDAAVASVLDHLRWRLGRDQVERHLRQGQHLDLVEALTLAEEATAALAEAAPPS